VPTRLPALLALLLLAACTVAACGDDDQGSSTSATARAEAGCPGGKVRFGAEPFDDPARLKPAFEAVAAGLERALGCEVDLTIVEDYSAEVLAMEQGKLDIAQFGPLGYVFAHQRADAEAVASFADANGKLTTYTAGIWVRKGSPIQDLRDLEGRSLALSEPGSTSGDALPRYALIEEAQLDPKSDLKLNYAGGHPEALLALTNGKVDAAEINSQQLNAAMAEGQFDASRYRQVWKSEPIPNDPITVRKDLEPAFKARVIKALTELDAETVGKVGKYLDVEPPGPLTRVTKSTYQPLFDLAEELGLTEKDV
jgi:phosphonate transport system substrate-binding protein